jgi:hypothetical protein
MLETRQTAGGFSLHGLDIGLSAGSSEEALMFWTGDIDLERVLMFLFLYLISNCICVLVFMCCARS